MKKTLPEQDGRQKQEIQHSIIVRRSAEAISRYCQSFENQKRTVSPWLRLERSGPHRTHWSLSAPFDILFQGDLSEGHLLGEQRLLWRSSEQQACRYDISLEIIELVEGQLSEVYLTYHYEIPVGSLYEKAFRIANLDPEILIEHWMEELKDRLEDDQELEGSEESEACEALYANEGLRSR